METIMGLAWEAKRGRCPPLPGGRVPRILDLVGDLVGRREADPVDVLCNMWGLFRTCSIACSP
jgi:hypothetical protein